MLLTLILNTRKLTIMIKLNLCDVIPFLEFTKIVVGAGTVSLFGEQTLAVSLPLAQVAAAAISTTKHRGRVVVGGTTFGTQRGVCALALFILIFTAARGTYIGSEGVWVSSRHSSDRRPTTLFRPSTQ